MSGRSLEQFTLEDRKSTLNRLIDQELLREQMRGGSDSSAVVSEQIAKRVAEIRRQYSIPQGEQEWRDILARHGLTEDGLKSHIMLELDLMRLVDSRLRPTVTIDSKSIESYYSQKLIPQLRQAGAREVPLAEVTPKIKELLTQQKMNQMLTAWLQNLRAGSDIHMDTASLGLGGQPQ
jgi:hypothetical protein